VPGTILFPIIRVARSPFPGTVATDVAIFGIGRDLLPVVVSATLTLTAGCAADGLKRLELGRLK
jgi:hypothetical protein